MKFKIVVTFAFPGLGRHDTDHSTLKLEITESVANFFESFRKGDDWLAPLPNGGPQEQIPAMRSCCFVFVSRTHVSGKSPERIYNFDFKSFLRGGHVGEASVGSLTTVIEAKLATIDEG